jgi:hypothetical protein
MNGRCKLCLREGIALQNSHVLPAAIYRALRSDAKTGNPNPCMVSDQGEVQTSRQEKGRLLCRDCEQRLSTHGERWLFTNGLRPNGNFALAKVLAASVAAIEHTPPTKIYFTASIPAVDTAAISYFAASIFWRASVHTWKDRADQQVSLGPFEDGFRRYLLGEAAFPTNSALLVVVRTKSLVSAVCRLPSKGRVDGARVYNFTMPGFVFNLFVGKNLPLHFRAISFAHNPDHPLSVTDIMESGILDGARRVFEAASRKGL